MKTLKLKGGSITYAVIFSLLVSVISMSLLMLFYYSSQSVEGYLDVDKAQRNARSGIQLLLSNQQLLKPSEKLRIDLFKNGNDSVELERQYWGAYELISATSVQQDYRFGLSALTGATAVSDSGAMAVYLADLNNPLKIAGKTEIKGTCYLPEGIIKPGNINGESFNGEKMVAGAIKKSSSQGLSADADFVEYMVKQFSLDTMSVSDSVWNMDKVPMKDTLLNSFTNPTIILYSKGEILLANVYLEGRIKVFSEKKITVKSSAQLKDIICYAPQVEFEEGFAGNLQTFANDSLVVGKKCKFLYPSILGTVRTVASKGNSYIKLKEECTFKGDIFAIQETADLAKHLTVSLDEHTQVLGRVFSADLLEPKGEISGSVIAYKVIYSNSSAVYENHLYNAVIDATTLPAAYVGSALIRSKKRKGVVKWL